MSNETKKKVLIFSPPLSNNVSGITSVVSNIIKYISTFEFIHIPVGRGLNEKRRFDWLFKQLLIILRLIKIKKENILFAHLNTGLEPFAITRDLIISKVLKYYNIRIILHIHGGRYLQNISSKIVKKIINKLLLNAHTIILLSIHEKLLFSSNFFHKNVVIVSNGVEIKARIVSTKESRKLLFIGRIVESKGIQVIYSALKILKDMGVNYVFNMYGTSDDKDVYIHLFDNEFGNQFSYGGIVDGDNKTDVYLESTIFLLPSLHSEGMPMALLEAMSFGCVPIVTDDASMKTVVNNGVNGIIVEKNNPEMLAEKIHYLLENPLRYKELADNAIQTIANSYSVQQQINKILAIYNSTLK